MESRQLAVLSMIIGCTAEIWLGGDRFAYITSGNVYPQRPPAVGHVIGYLVTLRAFNGQVARHFEAIEGADK